MNIKKMIMMFLIFQSCFLYCADLDKVNNLFENANKFYNEGKYLEANYLYRDIVSSNIISKDLYYNLASSYAAIGSNGYAVLYYEKALNIAPFDKEIKNTINSITGNDNYDSQIIVTMYILLILFLISFTVFIVLFIKSRKPNKFLLILFIIFLIPTIITNKLIKDDYVVTIEEANIYNGSSTKSDIVSIIREGEKLRVLEEYTNWYYVKGNFKGWISKSSAEKI
ncbi:tetratricopeptide repeat protein [Brachyspira alvinipulli]|uniref:tetratricopeptide repeat protein n=1 Tax=Brachyspira alvinipulli TaxID=84379 RepID=UPI0004B5149A|nr:SH3 domain-containing protein [Brachyspira alvinipulli]